MDERFVCEECDERLEYIGKEYCLKCGKPVGDGKEYCPDCEEKEADFKHGRALFMYNSSMKKSIAMFKYRSQKAYAEFYGKALYQGYSDWIKLIAPDALFPIPVHRERYRKRGYNHAELLATELGKHCKVPVITDYLIRTKNTLPQKGLSDKERYDNLRHAFSVNGEVQELYKNLKCVIIIDDIYTTGCTMNACSRVLREQGIRSVYFLCVCIGNGF